LLLAQSSLSIEAQKIYSVQSFGAIADGRTENAPSIQRAIDSCAANGGGQLHFAGPGVYVSGPIHLASNIEIVMEANATLKASADETLYTESAFGENEGEGMMWLSGRNLENISFRGTGSIDGNGIAFMGAEEDDAYVLKPFQGRDPRPHVLTLINCRNIRIHDLHIGNSAYWTIHLAGCTDVVIAGITLLNSLKVRNSDGIDIDHSKQVRISDCRIESGDDCICLKNRREYEAYGACEDITVSGCMMTSRSCAFKIGSENMDTIRRVMVSNCIIKNSNRGIGIQNRDEGVVTDVIFSNMIVEGQFFSDVWWGKAEPIYVTAYRRANGNGKDANWRFPKGATEGRVGKVSAIRFANIRCSSENGVYISAESSDKIEGIELIDVAVEIQKSTDYNGGIYDRRPSQLDGFVTGSTSAFYIDHVTNIHIVNPIVKWSGPLQSYYRYAIEGHAVGEFKLTGLSGGSADPKRYKGVMNFNQ